MDHNIENLSIYLPYELQLIVTNDEYEFLSDGHSNRTKGSTIILDCEELELYELEGTKYFKPALNPLSDLTYSRNWGELLRLLIERGIYKSSFAHGHDNFEARIVTKPFGKIFKLTNNGEWVIMISLNEPDRCKAVIYNWLIENHFDVLDQIGQGNAIKIEDLPN